ncbi:metal-sensitive transcriptional regulator [Corynebacterium uberis]|uniref:metal-sensitive transcriptional regulator n=1 Tax=Corynebacterium TaxID=1716 RepID=UPI001D0AE565|nr:MULTISPECIES: metal-sensitive transcriptional regulator [Corynebacterium]MCZ9310260.1 metal-sensitive transcriptional regulator [Corynebacterium sp. c6VSa_13]UDL73666.1 metal-sensitive transcriptional regulator [Corynebacterium uberis]UDL75453.1 metal-sensitive transcriptional regulator [Corynebacterium uberis]UDL77666.1 metal-sensitive transcriptional regulator [Corynebacterium uberis]UDL79950.1 metal-sensitive transcriptional regulator [Corynebacterium uberis]
MSSPKDPCCPETTPGYSPAASSYITRLKRIEGQVRGLQRMIEADEYCIDVVTQISAAAGALNSVAVALMEDHLHHCVAQAVRAGSDQGDEKIAEAMRAISRMVKG